MRILIALSFLLLSNTAQADRYWDLKREVADSVVSELRDTVVIRYCAQCGGDYRMLLVERAEVGPGDYSSDHSVVLHGKVLFAGTMAQPEVFVIPADAQCGEEDPSSPPQAAKSGDGELLDFPYSFVQYEPGSYRWIGIGTSEEKGNRALNWDPIKFGQRAQRRITECIAQVSGRPVPTKTQAQAKVAPPASKSTPPPVAPKKRGCGCQHGGESPWTALIFVLAFVATLWRRQNLIGV